jgi:uncharacterized protein YprB with RNaseH-like and TPR domain
VSHLRRQLDDLIASAHAVAPASSTRRARIPTGLPDILGGCEVCVGERAYWRVETPFDQTCPGHAAQPERFAGPLVESGAVDAPDVVEPRRTLVVDIETGGFSGTPVFLIGVVPLDVIPLGVVQFLARDYPEEEAILRALAELSTERDTWVTFNGKSFDEPFLRDRATLHRVALSPPRVHVDLLHAGRRAWGARLPNCRLVTLEEHVLGRRRMGDVPSSDVPDLFHHFMRTGNAAPLRPVLEHNRLDLVACTELLVHLSRPVP